MNIRSLIRKEVRKVMDASELEAARERLERLKEEGAPQFKIDKEKNTIKNLEKEDIDIKKEIIKKQKEVDSYNYNLEHGDHGTESIIELFDSLYKELTSSRSKAINDAAYANKLMRKVGRKWRGLIESKPSRFLDPKSRKILGFDGAPLTKAESMHDYGITSKDYDLALKKFAASYDKNLKKLRREVEIEKTVRKEMLTDKRKLESEIENLKKSRSSIFKM